MLLFDHILNPDILVNEKEYPDFDNRIRERILKDEKGVRRKKNRRQIISAYFIFFGDECTPGKMK